MVTCLRTVIFMLYWKDCKHKERNQRVVIQANYLRGKPSSLHQIRAPLANTCTWEKEDPLPRDLSANRAHQDFSNPPHLRSSPVPPTQSVRRVSTLSQAAPPPPSPSVRSVRPDFTNPSHRGAAFVLVG